MQSHYIYHNNSAIHYRKLGSGPKLLFCFHGYGRESSTFLFLERRLGNEFTIIAIDTPHHGFTKWEDEAPFKPAFLLKFLIYIRKSLNKENQKFALLGFSMGGRIALYLTQHLPDQIERLILLAPDGLSFNFWRWAGSKTWLGSKFLRYTVDNPSWLKWLVNKAEKWQFIHSNLASFIGYYMQSNEQRKTLYKRRLSMKLFSPSINKLKRIIKTNRIKVRMLFGAFDRVISYKDGERFKDGIDEFASVEVVHSGHNLLSEVHAEKIVELINA